MFLEHQISIVELILRDHFTLKSGILAGENSALLLQEYFTFYNTFKQKTAILNCDNIVLFLLFDQVNAALVSTSKVPSRKVCSLGSHICNTSEQLIQDQVLSKWMGESWNLNNCPMNSQLNYIFQITIKIWNELPHECCFLCSN